MMAEDLNVKWREHTNLKKAWYQYYTGNEKPRKHFEMKLICTECMCVWDRQAYSFNYCPGCGRIVYEIQEDNNET